jgi:hypothetical protein
VLESLFATNGKNADKNFNNCPKTVNKDGLKFNHKKYIKNSHLLGGLLSERVNAPILCFGAIFVLQIAKLK